MKFLEIIYFGNSFGIDSFNRKKSLRLSKLNIGTPCFIVQLNTPDDL
jgi:hypothetical protein